MVITGTRNEEVSNFINGDRKAYEKIYRKYGPKLFAFAYKLIQDKDEANDIVQEVFLKLWDKKHLINPELDFDQYLFKITKNLVFNKAKQRAYQFAANHYLSSKPCSENFTANEIYYNEVALVLDQAYNELPPMRKQVFTLSRLEGLNNQEIAQKLQTSKSNIENHLNKAIREIKKKLKIFKIIYLLITAFLYPFL